MFRTIFKWLGGAMALAGVIILAYAAYSYITFQQLEARLEAQVPGQTANLSPTTTPVVLLPSTNNDGNGQGTIPTMDPTRVSPSVTPFPTQATPVQPNSTVAAHL